MSDVNTDSNMVTLTTSDEKVLEVSLTVAKQSGVISRAINLEDMSAEDSKNFPVPIATEWVLKKVIEYCEKHVDATDESNTVTVTEEGSSTIQASRRISEEELRNWDKQFFNNVDMDMLYDLIMAANFLDITDLLDATCQKVADMMKGTSLKEIRETFNINNDFTPEEENQILRAHPWAFV